jgi:hypothetical protein
LGFSSEDQEKLQGCYIEAITRQQIVIKKSDDYTFLAYIMEAYGNQPRRTSDMQLIKIAEDTLAFSPFSRDLAIDAYHAWRNFGLKIEIRDNGKVHALIKAAELPILGQPDGEESTFNERYERRDV